jgi:hypothetical protein
MDNIKLRDYFAGLAMQSLIINQKTSGFKEPPNREMLAREAYLYADAMYLISLAKTPPPKPTPINLPKVSEPPKSDRLRK